MNYVIDENVLFNIDDHQYKEVYKVLCPSEGGKKRNDAIFKTMRDLFVYSAVLGFINNKRITIEKRYPTPPFRWSQFTEIQKKLLLVYSVSIKEDFEILTQPEEVKVLLEEYSNGGLEIMQQRMALDRLAYRDLDSVISEINERGQ